MALPDDLLLNAILSAIAGAMASAILSVMLSASSSAILALWRTLSPNLKNFSLCDGDKVGPHAWNTQNTFKRKGAYDDACKCFLKTNLGSSEFLSTNTASSLVWLPVRPKRPPCCCSAQNRAHYLNLTFFNKA